MPEKEPAGEPQAIPGAESSSLTTRPTSANAWSYLLSDEGYQVETAPSTPPTDCANIEAGGYDLLLLDLMMPDRSGMDVLRDIRQKDRETPVFVITAYGSVPVAVEALKAGANDFFEKPWKNEKLLIEIERTISKRRLESENVQLRRALKQRYSFPNIVGKGDRMVRVLDLVAQVAPSRSTILITGETGTGKELIAKAIHANSPRADQMFVPVNSGSLPPDLLESTLFGHVKGAFTGAIATRKGYFEIADRGTIFFDEIGTIGPETQAKLLRVIQEREFMPLGSSETVRVDVRIIAATNADLKKLVDEGRFREDLYYRLNVINIGLPPLRERKEDIPPLIEHFFGKYCQENEKFLAPDGHSLLALRAGGRAVADGPQLARQRARAGERGGARRGAGHCAGRAGRRAARLPASGRGPAHPPGRERPAARRRLAVRDRGRLRAPRDYGAPGSRRLEPDRSRREPARAAFHPQSEDQAAEHRDPEEISQPLTSPCSI